MRSFLRIDATHLILFKGFYQDQYVQGKLKSRLYIAVALIAGLVYLFRLDIFTPSNEHDTLKQGVFIYGGTTKVQVVLLKEARFYLAIDENRQRRYSGETQFQTPYSDTLITRSLITFAQSTLLQILRRGSIMTIRTIACGLMGLWIGEIITRIKLDQWKSERELMELEPIMQTYWSLNMDSASWQIHRILIVRKLIITLYKSCMRGSGKSWATSSPRSSHFASRRLARERERTIFPLSLL